MTSIFGSLLSWPVLVGLLAVVIIVLLISKFLVNKNKAMQVIVGVFEHAYDLIMFFMPEKYKEVFQSLVNAIKKVTDGVFTRDEALIIARDVFAVTLKKLNVTLSQEEAEFTDKMLVFIIDIIIKNPDVGVEAMIEVCNIKGFKLD